MSPVVCRHSAAVFLVWIVPAEPCSCERLADVGDGGTTPPFVVAMSWQRPQGAMSVTELLDA